MTKAKAGAKPVGKSTQKGEDKGKGKGVTSMNLDKRPAGANAARHPDWPTVKCDTVGCESTAKWRRMLSWHNDDDTDVFFYKCHLCVATAKSLTPQDALIWIMTEQGVARHRKQRAENFKNALENVQQNFPAMKTRHEAFTFTKANFATLFSGLGKYIIRRRELAEKQCQDMDKHAELSQKLKDCKNMAPGAWAVPPIWW